MLIDFLKDVTSWSAVAILVRLIVHKGKVHSFHDIFICGDITLRCDVLVLDDCNPSMNREAAVATEVVTSLASVVECYSCMLGSIVGSYFKDNFSIPAQCFCQTPCVDNCWSVVQRQFRSYTWTARVYDSWRLVLFSSLDTVLLFHLEFLYR